MSSGCCWPSRFIRSRRARSASIGESSALFDAVEQLRDASMGGGLVVVGPVSCENLISLAPEQEIALLLEDAVDLFAEHLIEIGHHPAAELEALGGILPRPTRRLHDSIHRNLGADNDLSHGSSRSLIA